MTDENSPQQKIGTVLGKHLAAIRNDRRYSLRQVEALSNNIISNAYLSQIEGGKIQQPSPNILHALANIYHISYEQLMEMAGFISVSREKGEVTHGRAATFAELHLSEDEEQELLEYLKFRRGLKGQQSENGR